MLYIVKFSGRDPAKYASDNGWRYYAQDGLCEYILNAYTGELLFERKAFYLIVTEGEEKYNRPRMFQTFDKAYSYAIAKSGIKDFYITPIQPEEKEGD